jgi:hypothetical protein
MAGMPHYITQIDYDLDGDVKVNPRYSMVELDPQNPFHRFLLSADEAEAEPYVPKADRPPPPPLPPPRIVEDVVAAIWAVWGEDLASWDLSDMKTRAKARELAAEAVAGLIAFRSSR